MSLEMIVFGVKVEAYKDGGLGHLGCVSVE